MTGNAQSGVDVFDVRKLRRLVELMKEHDLAEMDLKQGDVRVRLARGGAPVVTGFDPRLLAPMQSAAPAGGGGAAPAAAAEDEAHVALIKSPMVGTFYASPNPESPPFVKVGDHVGPSTTVCIVEAMKVFNEIPAGVSGKVVAVLAETGESVDFGRPLFKIDTRG